MDFYLRCIGKIREGQLFIINKNAFQNTLRKTFGEFLVNVTIETPKKQRSDSQNRYYWGVIVKMISDFSGESPNRVHEALKM